MCARQTGWNPRSALWRDDLNRFEKIVMSGCVGDEIRTKLLDWESRAYDELQEKGNREGTGSSKERLVQLLEPRVTNFYPNRESPLAVEVSTAFIEHEAAATLATATCMRRYHYSTHFEDRRFEYGGNNCTYMASYLQALVPGVGARVVELARLAWREAGWQAAAAAGDDETFPDPGTLGFRTNEHLYYEEKGVLSPHYDDDSVYTVVVALSSPDEYDGGEWILFDHEESKIELNRVKLSRLSAVVFLSSDALHGVAPVTRGTREVLVVELWEEDDTPFDGTNPDIRSFRRDFLHKGVDADPEDDSEDDS